MVPKKRDAKKESNETWIQSLHRLLDREGIVETRFVEQNLPAKFIEVLPKINECNRLRAMTGSKFNELGLNTIVPVPRSSKFRVYTFFKGHSNV